MSMARRRRSVRRRSNPSRASPSPSRDPSPMTYPSPNPSLTSRLPSPKRDARPDPRGVRPSPNRIHARHHRSNHMAGARPDTHPVAVRHGSRPLAAGRRDNRQTVALRDSRIARRRQVGHPRGQRRAAVTRQRTGRISSRSPERLTVHFAPSMTRSHRQLQLPTTSIKVRAAGPPAGPERRSGRASNHFTCNCEVYSINVRRVVRNVVVTPGGAVPTDTTARLRNSRLGKDQAQGLALRSRRNDRSVWH